MKQAVSLMAMVALVCVAQAAASPTTLGRRGLLGSQAAITNVGSTYALAATNDQIVQAVNRGFAPTDAILATTGALTIARVASNKDAKLSDFDGTAKPAKGGVRPAAGRR